MQKLFLLALVASIAGVVMSCGGDDAEPTSATTAVRIQVAEGVFAQKAEPPPLPPGSIAISDYFTFEAVDDSGVVIGLPLSAPQNSTVDLGYYSYVNGEWGGVIGAISLEQGGTILQGVFPNVPENLIALRTSGETPPPLGGPPLR